MKINTEKEIKYHEDMIQFHSDSIDKLKAIGDHCNLLKYVDNYYKYKNYYIRIDAVIRGALYGVVFCIGRVTSISIEDQISESMCNVQITKDEFKQAFNMLLDGISELAGV